MKIYLKKCCFIILGVLTFLFTNIQVNAATKGFNFFTFKENGKRKWEIETYKDSKVLESPGGYFTSNGTIAFCIEPGILYLDVADGSYTVHTNASQFSQLTGYDEELLHKLELISYYGYGYNGDKSDENYMATQMLIWNTISPNSVKIISGDQSVINSKINAIKKNVDNALERPSFSYKTLEVALGEETSIIDTKGVLNGFKVSNCQNCKATIENNTLKVTANSMEDAKVTFTKSISNTSVGSVLYTAENYQKLMTFGDPDDTEAILTLKVKGSEIKVQKADKETGKIEAQGEATLKGAVYGIYDEENNLVAEITTDEKGQASYYVDYGIYTVKELVAPVGYKLSDEVFTVTIEESNAKDGVTIVAYDEVIKGEGILYKESISVAGNVKAEDGAEFEIINSDGKVVKRLITDEDGVSLIKLPYGSYTLHQVKGLEHYTLSEDIHFTISNEEKVFKFYLKDLEYSNFTLTKTDISGTAPVEGATIEIYKKESTSNKLIYSGITDKDGKIYIEHLELGEYYFIETNAPDGYLLNKDMHEFSITEYGISYEESFENDYTVVEFEKRDYQNGNLLEGAKICIYNEFNEEVACGITDEFGKIIFEKLPLGKFYYQEVEAPVGYELNNEKYEFELTEENSKLEIALTNELIVEVPDTHKDSFPLLAVTIGLLLIGIGLIVYGKKK